MLFDSKEVVSKEVLIPRNRGADNVFDSCRLCNGSEGLVAENDDEDHRHGSGQRRQRRKNTVCCAAPTNDPGDRPGSDE